MSDADTGERAAADPEPHAAGGWNPAEDLCIQVEHALECLDETINLVDPEDYHVDQQVVRLAPPAEVSHG
jgi:hypothetical protein